MSNPQDSINLITAADRKSARLTHKFTASKGEFKAVTPIPAFLQQPAPTLPEGVVESKTGYCESYGNAHLHKSDTPHGTMYRASGESKYLCADCLEQRRKALASQNYPSAQKPPTVTTEPKLSRTKRATDKQIIDGGGSVTYRGYELYAGEFDDRTGYYGRHANGIDAVGPFWNLTACKRAVDHDVVSTISTHIKAANEQYILACG